VSRGSRRLIVALVAALLAAGLVACGGSDSSTTTEADGQGQAGGKESKPAGEASKQADAKNDDSSAIVPKQHKDSGGGSAQFKVAGGDNSVQEFGDEADASERDAAAVALHNFLDARADGNWTAACSYMSKSMVESLEELSSQAGQSEGTSCGAILEKLTNPAASQSLKAEAAQANVGSLRTEGERAFVIYTGIGDTIIAMPMADEEGAWKVASLAGTPLN